MNSTEIRRRFLDFFEKRGHAILPSAPLVTPDEKGITNSTLFNTAGMQPLVPYLLGKPHPKGKRLANVQKCLRTVDIDDIGDKTHATFFEMLGNWSLGDYFKKEAINWSYEFLTSKKEVTGDRGLGLDPNRLYVTVFEGDEKAPKDDEAALIWKELFKENKVADSDGDTLSGKSGRIFYMPAENNWWQAGDDGPCGPDSEMFYDVANKFNGRGLTREEFIKADSARDVVEVWNDVFMQYEKKEGKIIGKLPKPSVDTGAGLERLAMTMQGTDNIYATDLLKPIMDAIEDSSKPGFLKEKRIISDHIRSSAFIIAEGVKPSNTDRGYILRRLLRRGIHFAKMIELKTELSDFANIISGIYKDAYPEIGGNLEMIKKEIETECERFENTLEMGLKEFNKSLKSNSQIITGKDAFVLFSSYGLPIDMIADLITERGLAIDLSELIKEFNAEFKNHQNLSRSGAEQKFKGGLADATSEMVVRYHTATHLLHQALHDVLGESVAQKGSNITTERLRFDFSHPSKMTDDEKKKVEEIVNDKIRKSLPVNKLIMPREKAEQTGARHFFGEKYGDEISIYFVGKSLEDAYSKEFCGGPHVANTSELAGPEGKWRFRIVKEEAVAQGVRRIKAILD